MSEENGIFQPVDLSPEMQRESERRDMLIVANMPNATPKYNIDYRNLIVEMNLRLAQYVGQFKSFTFEALIIQAVNDFAPWVFPRYEIVKGVMDRTQPVGVTVKGKKAIYANPAVKRSDYEQSNLLAVFVYSLQEEK